MRYNLKRLSVFFFVLTLITVISASERKKPEKKEHQQMIVSRALIEDDFSGIESTPIVRAFISWMNETQGDILVLPPTDGDGLFYDVAIKGTSQGSGAFEMSLEADGRVPDPWSKGCRNSFYIVRTTSKSDVVKALDGENRTILAFTFTGCMFKFIVVVADRMRDEEMMYATMLHELGHMWGLPDNEEGQLSIMNGHYPTAKCITKNDISKVYALHNMSEFVPADGGCVPVEQSSAE